MTHAGDNRVAFVNGAFVPLAEASIPVMDRGFLFGDGVYEVTAVIERRFADNDAHLARLDRSLRAIDIPNPYSATRWTEIEQELARRNALENGLIYLHVTRGVAERNFQYPAGLAPTVVLFAQFKPVQYNPIIETGARVVTLPDLRWSRCDIKSTSLLAQVLTKQAAQQAGANEAWMVRDGAITEGASSTVFIVTREGQIVTRRLSSAVLPGITRLTMLKIARDMALELVERDVTPDAVLAAREAFYTSASTIAVPVATLDGQPIGDGRPGPVFQALYSAYMDAIMAQPPVF
ncbi:D-amino-acid transaminase [Gluconacetobacter sp. Hr-1-5]|uniref:D-amino-acid transaminase n=1 Tax=Gluconacetobacter sp. Hr-1-5 TaxID=3395370 RepID=UPI003B52AC94